MQFFNIQEADLLSVVRQDPFLFELVDHRGHRLSTAADEAGDVFVCEEIRHTKAFGRVLAQVLFYQLPEEVQEAGLDVFIEEVQ